MWSCLPLGGDVIVYVVMPSSDVCGHAFPCEEGDSVCRHALL